MHELSLAEGIIDIVETTAREHALKTVRAVHVAIGELAGVDPDALRFAWGSVTKTGVAANAELRLERTAGSAWCMNCAKSVPLKAYGEPCPICGSYQLVANGGTEMRVVDIIPGD